MRVRLALQAEVDGSQWEFWKPVDAEQVPSVGDIVRLGARTGASAALNERAVTKVRWGAELADVEVRLADLDPSWLRGNRREFGEAGWTSAMAGDDGMRE